MADTEEKPTENGAAETIVEAKPERKGPVKRFTKPNTQDLKVKIDALEAQIAASKTKIDTIRSDLEGRKRRADDSESQGIRNQLQELRTQFQQVLGQKQQARAELENATKARDALRQNVRGMKGKMEYTTVEKIDEQMARLESRLQHTSMPLAEEKKVLEDIKKLRQSRASVATYNDKLERLNADDDCRSIMDRVKAYDEQLTAIKTQEEGLRRQLGDIRAKDDARNVDVPKLHQERDDAREVIRLAVQNIRELRAEHRTKHDEWWAGECAWREQRAADKARKDAEYAEMRAQRDAERKKRQAELAGDPFSKELVLCEQVRGYLSRYVAEDKEAAAPEAAAEIKPLEGMTLFSRKKVEDDNPYASLEKKRKGKKGRSTRAAPEDKVLNHTFDILTAFSKLKIEAPITTSKVPAALESVKERETYYKQKQEDAKKNGDSAAAEADEEEKAAPAQKKQAPEPYEGGAAEPTPAEAAGGIAPSGADQNGADAPQGAWATDSGAAAPAANGPAKDAPAADGVSLGLTHSEDGSVSVSISVR